jgi:hypothetical protein
MGLTFNVAVTNNNMASDGDVNAMVAKASVYTTSYKTP